MTFSGLMLGAPVCHLCGQATREYRVDPASGGVMCTTHPWCTFCNTAHMYSPCAEELGRITTPTDALAAGRRVHHDLTTVGIQLPDPAVRLVDHLPGPQQGRCLKVGSPGWPHRSATIEIEAGLGPSRFGHVWAHEHTHALCHLHGAARLDPDLEEGVCEMVAVVWLTSRCTPRSILWMVLHNPHPVYGMRMREAVASARRHSVPTVLGSILNDGTLPTTGRK